MPLSWQNRTTIIKTQDKHNLTYPQLRSTLKFLVYNIFEQDRGHAKNNLCTIFHPFIVKPKITFVPPIRLAHKMTYTKPCVFLPRFNSKHALILIIHQPEQT